MLTTALVMLALQVLGNLYSLLKKEQLWFERMIDLIVLGALSVSMYGVWQAIGNGE